MWDLKFSLFDFKTSGFLISRKVTTYEGEEINLFPAEGFVAHGRQGAVIFLQRPADLPRPEDQGTWSGGGYAFSLGRIFSSLLCFLALLMTSSTKHS